MYRSGRTLPWPGLGVGSSGPVLCFCSGEISLGGSTMELDVVGAGGEPRDALTLETKEGSDET